MASERNHTLDIISGVMILWVIVFHSFQWGNVTDSIVFKVLIRFLYFVMPWFYFKSGYVYNTKQSLKVEIIKGVNQLLMPMFKWAIIGYIIRIPEYLVKGETIDVILLKPVLSLVQSGDLYGNIPLWFILSLFMVRITIKFMVNLSLIFQITFSVVFAVIGWNFQRLNLTSLPLGFISFPIGMFFTLSGFICNQLKLKRVRNKFSLPLLILTLLMSLSYSSYIDVHMNKLWYGNYWTFIINSFLAINLSLMLFANVRSKLLEWFGRKSIIYLVAHWPVFYIVNLTLQILDFPQKGFTATLILAFSGITISTLLAIFKPGNRFSLFKNVAIPEN